MYHRSIFGTLNYLDSSDSRNSPVYIDYIRTHLFDHCIYTFLLFDRICCYSPWYRLYYRCIFYTRLNRSPANSRLNICHIFFRCSLVYTNTDRFGTNSTGLKNRLGHNRICLHTRIELGYKSRVHIECTWGRLFSACKHTDLFGCRMKARLSQEYRIGIVNGTLELDYTSLLYTFRTVFLLWIPIGINIERWLDRIMMWVSVSFWSILFLSIVGSNRMRCIPVGWMPRNWNILVCSLSICLGRR